MATSGIGEGGVALIKAERPVSVSDHIRRLQSITLAALSTERDHVVGQANYELARLALASHSSSRGTSCRRPSTSMRVGDLQVS